VLLKLVYLYEFLLNNFGPESKRKLKYVFSKSEGSYSLITHKLDHSTTYVNYMIGRRTRILLKLELYLSNITVKVIYQCLAAIMSMIYILISLKRINIVGINLS
jgi:hypothetical protein